MADGWDAREKAEADATELHRLQLANRGLAAPVGVARDDTPPRSHHATWWRDTK